MGRRLSRMETMLEKAQRYHIEPIGNIHKPYDYPTIDAEYVTYHQVSQTLMAMTYSYPAMFKDDSFVTSKMQFFPYRIAFLYLNTATLTLDDIENKLYEAWFPMIQSLSSDMLHLASNMTFFQFSSMLDCMASRSWDFEKTYHYLEEYHRKNQK